MRRTKLGANTADSKKTWLLLLVISGLGNDEIQTRGGLPEGVTCFQKPVNYAKLEALVQKHRNAREPQYLPA